MTPGTEAWMDPIEAMLYVVSFVFGASIGSFLNVVIWRVPRGESIVRPPSHCPGCGSPIRWYQNIPIVSWLALRGLFLLSLRRKLDAAETEAERERITMAARWGLAALDRDEEVFPL